MTGFRTPGGLEGIAAIRYRKADGLHAAGAIRFRDADNILQTMYGAAGFTATASPTSLSGFGYSHAPIQITTGYATATLVGASGSSTYSWSADGGFSPINPTSQTTAFRSGSISAGNDASGTATCVITHAGTPYSTNSVDLYAQNTGT